MNNEPLDARSAAAAARISIYHPITTICKKIVFRIYNLDPYVKMLMFNPSGRLVKKKKSSIKFDTKDPEFEETINVEVIKRNTCIIISIFL